MPYTYQEAIENSNIVSKTNIDGIITFVNDEFCKISGYSYNELIGQNHNIVRHPDASSSSFKKLWDTILNKKAYKSTVKNLSKNGKTIYLNTTITPIFDEIGNIKEFIAIRYDVTKEVELKKALEKKDKDLKELNKTLEERVQFQTLQLKEINESLEIRVKKEIQKNAEKEKILFWQSRMASLGQMLGNIAHQWRQPLTELSLTLFNLKRASNSNKDISILYQDCKNIISNMSNTIEDFTNFFSPDKEKILFDINDSINESLLIMQKTIKTNNLNISFKKNSFKILGVSNELSQVIINLIQNSNDAFIHNKIIDKNINIDISEDLHQNFLIITYRDNAGGIKDEIIDKIFEPYFTTKHSSTGTGLGLFMSKMIIEKSLNGTIFIKSTNKNTEFIIKIPQGEK